MVTVDSIIYKGDFRSSTIFPPPQQLGISFSYSRNGIFMSQFHLDVCMAACFLVAIQRHLCIVRFYAFSSKGNKFVVVKNQSPQNPSYPKPLDYLSLSSHFPILSLSRFHRLLIFVPIFKTLAFLVSLF